MDTVLDTLAVLVKSLNERIGELQVELSAAQVARDIYRERALEAEERVAQLMYNK